jgi:hypothetical protein
MEHPHQGVLGYTKEGVLIHAPTWTNTHSTVLVREKPDTGGLGPYHSVRVNDQRMACWWTKTEQWLPRLEKGTAEWLDGLKYFQIVKNCISSKFYVNFTSIFKKRG